MPAAPFDPGYYAQLLASRIPAEVRKAIDSREFNDRLVEAAKLSAAANDPQLSPAKRQEKRDRAQQVLSATPRAVTERQVADKVAKAALLGDSPTADALRRQARELLDRNPPAPRRSGSVRKQQDDGDDGPIPVFDANGILIGIVADPENMTPLNSAYAAPQVPDAAPDDLDCMPDGTLVAKSARVGVYDQRGRRFAVDRLAIRSKARKTGASAVAKVAKAVPVRGLIQVTDQDGRTYWANPADLKGPGSPEAQARDTSSVTAGGTTGIGQPRSTGPAAALPLDGPQARRPGDVPDRTVIKSGWVDVHTSKGKLAGVIKSAHLIQPTPGAEQNVRADGGRKFCAVHDAAGRRVGYAYRANLRPTRVARMAAVLKSAGVDVSGPHVFAPDALSAEGSCVCGQAPGDSVHREMVAKTAARAGSRAASPQPPAVRAAKAAGAVRNTAITWPDWLVS